MFTITSGHTRRWAVPVPARCGRICIGKRKINLSQVFAGQVLGLREVDDQVWIVSFLNYDLGFFDNQEDRVEPATNPFAPVDV